jgi:hypothetical protein
MEVKVGFQDDKSPFQVTVEEVLHLFEEFQTTILNPTRNFMILKHQYDLLLTASKNTEAGNDVQVTDKDLYETFLSTYGSCPLLTGEYDESKGTITYKLEIKHYFEKLALLDKSAKDYRILKLSEIYDGIFVAFNELQPMLVSNSRIKCIVIHNQTMFINVEPIVKLKTTNIIQIHHLILTY